ncbi:hypothetical protein ACGVWS_12195 [Enterobacteriaceae bacterium LUAb1]
MMADFEWLPDVSQIYSDGTQSIAQPDFSKIMGNDFTMINGELTCDPQQGSNNNPYWIWGKADPSATGKESKFTFSNNSVLNIKGDADKTTFLFNNAVPGSGAAAVTIKLLHRSLLKINHMSLVDAKNVGDVTVNLHLLNYAQFIAEKNNAYNLSGNISVEEFASLIIRSYPGSGSVNASQANITVSSVNHEYMNRLPAFLVDIEDDFFVTEPENSLSSSFNFLAKDNAVTEVICSKFNIKCTNPAPFQVRDSASLEVECYELICDKGTGGYFELLPGRGKIKISTGESPTDTPPPIDIEKRSYAEGLFRFDTNNGTEENYGVMTLQGIKNAFDFQLALSKNLFYINGKPVQNNQLFKAEYGGKAGTIISLFNPKQK